MGKKRKNLSHEEIWDDSALVESWNAAYEEYKYYHSLHARGEKVQDHLDAYEREESQPQSGEPSNGSTVPEPLEHDSSEDGEIEEREEDGKPELNHHVGTDQTEMVAATTAGIPEHTAAREGHALNSEPQNFGILGKAEQDPALKNLMMSWYWAGYYTGLYEGQKQSTHQNSTTENTNSKP